MEQQARNSHGPLAMHNKKFSSAGLLVSYAKDRTSLFTLRVLFGVGIALLAHFWLGSLLPMLCYLLFLIAELVETYVLRQLEDRLERGLAVWRAQLETTVLAIMHAVTVAMFAALPLVVGEIYGQGTELIWGKPFFALCVVICPALSMVVEMRYHKVATTARVGILACCPLLITLYEYLSPATMMDIDGLSLFVMGTGFVYAAMLCMFIFVHRRQLHAERAMRSQALQRQALADAYMRLYDQKQEARRLALIAENANDSVMLLGRNSEILWANDAFTRITGFTFDEALGKNPRELLHPEGNVPGIMSDIERGRWRAEPFRLEVESRRKDGSMMWIDTNQVPVFDEKGMLEAYIAVERDVTAAKEHEEQLEAAREAAEEGARVKEEFLATMSHEFRTPMNGVIGMAQLLRESALDPEQKLYTDTILSSSRALLSLINDVLDLSKMNASGVTLSNVDFDIRQCFEDALRLLRPQAEGKGLGLAFAFSEELPAMVHGDDRRLRQVIVNLVGNAIKFTETGEVSVLVEPIAASDGLGQAAQTEKTTEPVFLRFVVRDTGIGIPLSKQEVIFDRFSQADAAITRKFGGTGLGLPISKRLAEAMGGRISVRSEPDQGAEFAVELCFGRASVACPAAGADDTADHLAPLSGLAGLRVLVAEDNRVNQLLIRKFLEKAEVELHYALDGEQAVAMAADLHPHVVLMDVSMPKKNGLDATREIRALDIPQPHISALTANVDDKSRAACEAAGMNAFLSKPLARRKLIEILLQVAQRETV